MTTSPPQPPNPVDQGQREADRAIWTDPAGGWPTAAAQDAADQGGPHQARMATPPATGTQGGPDVWVTVPVDKVVTTARGRNQMRPTYASADGYQENPGGNVPPTMAAGKLAR